MPRSVKRNTKGKKRTKKKMKGSGNGESPNGPLPGSAPQKKKVSFGNVQKREIPIQAQFTFDKHKRNDITGEKGTFVEKTPEPGSHHEKIEKVKINAMVAKILHHFNISADRFLEDPEAIKILGEHSRSVARRLTILSTKPSIDTIRPIKIDENNARFKAHRLQISQIIDELIDESINLKFIYDKIFTETDPEIIATHYRALNEYFTKELGISHAIFAAWMDENKEFSDRIETARRIVKSK